MRATKEELLRSTIELAIEDAICEVFKGRCPNIRDDCYFHDSQVWERRIAAVILTALYMEYGGSIQSLAVELLIDTRDRAKVDYPITHYPTIHRLWLQYQEFITSPFWEGELLRAYKAQVERVMHRNLAALDKLPTLDMFV